MRKRIYEIIEPSKGALLSTIYDILMTLPLKLVPEETRRGAIDNPLLQK